MQVCTGDNDDVDIVDDDDGERKKIIVRVTCIIMFNIPVHVTFFMKQKMEGNKKKRIH